MNDRVDLTKWATDFLLKERGYSHWETGGGCYLIASPPKKNIVFDETVDGLPCQISVVFGLTDESGMGFEVDGPNTNILVGAYLFHVQSGRSTAIAFRQFNDVNVNDLPAFESKLHGLNFVRNFRIDDLMGESFFPGDEFEPYDSAEFQGFFEETGLMQWHAAQGSPEV